MSEEGATYKVIGGHEVNLPKIDVHVSIPELKALLTREYPAPIVNMAPPVVNVASSEKEVHVHVPESPIPAVEIRPQEINVNPVIHVNLSMEADRKILLSLTIGVYLLFFAGILQTLHIL